MNSKNESDVPHDATSVNQPTRNGKTSKASGPKTAAAKSRVRLNALRHGFYSAKLVVLESEKTLFEVWRSALRAQLKPDTPMLQLAFERVMSAAWRYRQALFMEAKRMRPHLEPEQQQGSSDPVILEPPQWYSSGRLGLNRAEKILGELRADIKEFGGGHLDEQKEVIVKSLGTEFFDALVDWQPKNTTAVLGAEMLAAHAKKLNLSFPPKSESGKEMEFVLLDDRARWDMMVKIVDLKLQEVHELRRLLDSAGAEPEREAALDTLSRYITAAARELERAMDWHLYLRTKGI